MIHKTKEELEDLVGVLVTITTEKGNTVVGIVDGVAHTDADSYLMLGDRRYGMKGILSCTDVNESEDDEEDDELATPTDEEFIRTTDALVEGVFSTYRYRHLTEPHVRVEDTLKDAIGRNKLTDHQAQALTYLVEKRTQGLQAPDAEMSDDVKKALDSLQPEDEKDEFPVHVETVPAEGLENLFTEEDLEDAGYPEKSVDVQTTKEKLAEVMRSMGFGASYDQELDEWSFTGSMPTPEISEVTKSAEPAADVVQHSETAEAVKSEITSITAPNSHGKLPELTDDPSTQYPSKPRKGKGKKPAKEE